MDLEKLLNSLEAFLYEAFGLLVPGACLALILLLFSGDVLSNPGVTLKPTSLQCLSIGIVLYILGMFLNGGRRAEKKLISFVMVGMRRLKFRRKAGARSAGTPDPSASYQDKNVYRSAREQVANHLGLQARDLSGSEVFNLCMSVAGSASAPYRKFVALRDMVRGLSFAVTMGAALALIRLYQSPDVGLSTIQVATLLGVHLPPDQTHLIAGRAFYACLVLVLVAAKFGLAEREQRFEGIARRVVYPLALVAMKNPSSETKEGKSNDRQT